MPHLNYGLLLWGVNLKDIFLFQKKAIQLVHKLTIRLVTHNTYTSHTESILKENGLLNLVDMFVLNKFEFKIFTHVNIILSNIFGTLHYVGSELQFKIKSIAVPRIHHVHVESLFVYQLVKILILLQLLN